MPVKKEKILEQIATPAEQAEALKIISKSEETKINPFLQTIPRKVEDAKMRRQEKRHAKEEKAASQSPAQSLQSLVSDSISKKATEQALAATLDKILVTKFIHDMASVPKN